jgi:glutamine amidotransferase PdxT
MGVACAYASKQPKYEQPRQFPTELPGGPLEMVFIRSPGITRVGEGVDLLACRDGFTCPSPKCYPETK